VKRPRAVWLTVAILLLGMLLLVVFVPARWVVPWVQPRLHGLALGGVHGMLWDGVADDVRGTGGRTLGRLQWQLSRRALWGHLELQFDLQGPHLVARGHLQRDGQGRPVWSDVTLRADLAAWAPRLQSPLGTPQGTLIATLVRAVMQAGWPLELQGRVQWRDARMQTHEGAVALGQLTMDLAGANGVPRGRLRDEGHGPLQVQGSWQASPLGWRLDLRLRPRVADPSLHRWLARLGRPGVDGSVQLHRRGGLAAVTVENTR
jgi:general secretion pathway protein N